MAPALLIYQIEGAGWTPNQRWSKRSIRQENGYVIFEAMAPGKTMISGTTLDEIDFRAVVEDWNDGCQSVCEMQRGDPRPHLREYLDSMNVNGPIVPNQAGMLATFYFWMLGVVSKEQRWPSEQEVMENAKRIGLAEIPRMPWL